MVVLLVSPGTQVKTTPSLSLCKEDILAIQILGTHLRPASDRDILRLILNLMSLRMLQRICKLLS